MFKFNNITLADISTSLIAIGSFILWFYRAFKSRTPPPIFTTQSVYHPMLKHIIIKPQRGTVMYSVAGLYSELPLYQCIKGIDGIGRGVPVLTEQYDLTKPFNIMPTNQVLNCEPCIEFYLDLRNYQKSFYTLRIKFISEHFPFCWYKRINISV